jgi:hypothetical protein
MTFFFEKTKKTIRFLHSDVENPILRFGNDSADSMSDRNGNLDVPHMIGQESENTGAL